MVPFNRKLEIVDLIRTPDHYPLSLFDLSDASYPSVVFSLSLGSRPTYFPNPQTEVQVSSSGNEAPTLTLTRGSCSKDKDGEIRETHILTGMSLTEVDPPLPVRHHCYDVDVYTCTMTFVPSSSPEPGSVAP